MRCPLLLCNSEASRARFAFRDRFTHLEVFEILSQSFMLSLSCVTGLSKVESSRAPGFVFSRLDSFSWAP
jgi:hypothetical protein